MASPLLFAAASLAVLAAAPALACEGTACWGMGPVYELNPDYRGPQDLGGADSEDDAAMPPPYGDEDAYGGRDRYGPPPQELDERADGRRSGEPPPPAYGGGYGPQLGRDWRDPDWRSRNGCEDDPEMDAGAEPGSEIEQDGRSWEPHRDHWDRDYHYRWRSPPAEGHERLWRWGDVSRYDYDSGWVETTPQWRGSPPDDGGEFDYCPSCGPQ